MQRKLSLAVVFALLLSLAACDSSEYHKAAQAAATISTSLKGAQSVNASLYASGLLDKDETIAVAQAISDSTMANDQFVAKIRTLGGKFDASTKPLVVAWVSELAASIEKLNAEGVLRIKNPQAQQQLKLSIAAIQAAIQLIETAVR